MDEDRVTISVAEYKALYYLSLVARDVLARPGVVSREDLSEALREWQWVQRAIAVSNVVREAERAERRAGR